MPRRGGRAPRAAGPGDRRRRGRGASLGRRPDRGGTLRPPRPAAERGPARPAPPMMPASTSPVPAVASRASPVSTTSTVPVGVGDHRGPALEQHDAPAAPARSRAAAKRSAPGGCAGQALELAVVGGEDHVRARPGRRRRRAERGEAVGVDHDRRTGRPSPPPMPRRHSSAHLGAGRRTPRPLPTTSAAKRSSAVEHLGRPSPSRGSGGPHDLDRHVRRVGAAARDATAARSPAPARCAPGRDQRGGAVHARAARPTTHTAARHLWVDGRAAAASRRTSAASTSAGVGRRHVEPDVDHLDRDRRARRPGCSSRPGLERGERHGARRPAAPGRRSGPRR